MTPYLRTLLPMLLLVTPSYAETYLVTPDGTGDFPDIQAAVDAAQNGDIIELTDGTFLGEGNRNIAFAGKSLTIRSQGGDPTGCLIDCERQGRGFVGHLGSSSLEGLTVTRGQDGAFGGAIMIMTGSLSVHKCIFHDNHAPGNGGAVFVDMCSSTSFSECSFVANVGGAGGAICT